MKILKTISLLLVMQSVLFSQSGWFVQHTGSQGQSLYSIFFVNDNTGIAVGNDGLIKKTTNAGINWFQQNSGVTGDLRSVFFVNPSLGFIAADSVILKTTNGGNNWIVNFHSHYYNRSIYFVNALTGFFINEPQKYSEIFKTTNGGTTWNVFYSSMYIFGLYIFDENNICAVGANNFFHTTNGGINWNITTIDLGAGPISYSFVKFCNSNTGYCFGTHTSFPNTTLRISKTTNSGLNWSIQLQQISGITTDLCLTGCDTGYALSQGIIRKSVNGGANWFMQYGGTSPAPNCVYFVNNQTGYSGCLNSGSILKTTNGGGPVRIQTISNKIPNIFSLSQNYPNPFNPSTKIRFEIAANVKRQTSNVKLTVYSMLGEEVVMLVNQELKPGVYEVDFDGANLPSGTYFYRLQAGDYTETKKMVLLK